MLCPSFFVNRNHIISHSHFLPSMNSKAVSLTTLKQSDAVPSTLKSLRSARVHVTQTSRIQNINTHSSKNIRMQLIRDFWKWRQLDNIFFSVRIPGSETFYGFVLFNLTSLWIFKRKEKGRNKYGLSFFYSLKGKAKYRKAILVCEECMKERFISWRTGSKCQEKRWVSVPAKKLYFIEILISSVNWI
jgi:hypothetical protein